MIELNQLPARWQTEIRELRSENARIRIARRELRIQLDELISLAAAQSQ